VKVKSDLNGWLVVAVFLTRWLGATDVEEFVAWVTSYSQRVLGQQVNREEVIRTGEHLHRCVSF
jgi:hypothetical protein